MIDRESYSTASIAKRAEARKKVDRIHALVDQLADEVNVLGDHTPLVEAFSSALQKQHRTLQQSIVEVLINGLSCYGDVARTDARNAAAVELCKTLGEHKLPLI